MKTIKIAGVPEHFNLPWHLAMEEDAFADKGIDLQWIDVFEGTGKMSKMLATGETDLAVILTEGIVKSIIDGNPSLIVQEYVSSPLLWGIHVASGSPFKEIHQLEGRKAAISRYGSGSHLMAYVLAEKKGWDLETLEFTVVDHLEGAVAALSESRADYFLWERFTTKPIVDDGIFRRLGDCPTPWPCFVIAARVGLIEESASLIRHILDTINLYTQEFRRIPSIDRTLANRYQQQLEDIREWLGMTRWSQKQIEVQVINNVIDTLSQLKLIDKSPPGDQLLTSL